jgi:hypothetical protein
MQKYYSKANSWEGLKAGVEGGEGRGGRKGGGQGKGGEMTQTLYAHMNKQTNKKIIHSRKKKANSWEGLSLNKRNRLSLINKKMSRLIDKWIMRG